MSIATIDIQPRVSTVVLAKDSVSVHLEDGRIVSAPLAWYPRLHYATTQEQNNWRVFQDTDERDIIFWEALDEMIPVIALLTGTPSRESQRSFEKWLAERTNKN